ENFMLTLASFRRLGNHEVQAFVNLKTYELNPLIRRLMPAKRLPYMAARANRWIRNLRRLHPRLSFQGSTSIENARRFSQLPSRLTVQGTAREICALGGSPGVSPVYVTKISGHRPRTSPKAPLTWYCVRAL